MAKKKQQSNKLPTYIIGGALALVMIIAAIILVWNVAQNPPKGEVAVFVNGEAIYEQDIIIQQSRIPAELRPQYSYDVLLNQTIDKVLILQEVRSQGVVATDEEVETRIEEQAQSFGVDTAQLKTLLTSANVSWEEYESSVEEEVIITKYIDQVLLADVEVSDEEIQAYYQANTAQFTAKPGESRIRHILVETEEEAQEIYKRLLDGESFVILAQERSIGPSGPQGGDLGLVTDETPFVEPFKTVALSLEPEEISEPVETEFGWHVIKRESDTLSFGEVEEQVEELLRQQKVQAKFSSILAQLRADATIVYP